MIYIEWPQFWRSDRHYY